MDSKIPYIDVGLLQYLEGLYRDQAPEPSQQDREIWMNRGAVGVIRHLKLLYQDQLSKELGEDKDVYG